MSRFFRLSPMNHHPYFPLRATTIWDTTCFRVQSPRDFTFGRHVINGHYDFPWCGCLTFALGFFSITRVHHLSLLMPALCRSPLPTPTPPSIHNALLCVVQLSCSHRHHVHRPACVRIWSLPVDGLRHSHFRRDEPRTPTASVGDELRGWALCDRAVFLHSVTGDGRASSHRVGGDLERVAPGRP
jgi:hypothetical protein